jgi:ABC-type multidrug transport system ATPase subunit
VSEIRIRIHGVTFAYEPSAPVIRDVDLDLGGGLVLLVGPNGCGKSTLLKLMAGVERPDAGTIEIGGFDLWSDELEARRLLAYVPEQPDVSPYASVVEVLELVAHLRGQAPERIVEVQALFGLETLGRRSIRELSKGQRRRVLLAAARLGAPPVLLLDEPLDALDRRLREDTLGWLNERRNAGAPIVVVTHELELLSPLADAAIYFVDGHAAMVEKLGESASDRMRVLESLARGEPDRVGLGKQDSR